jgi:tetratricopeptide (TPR) repeat protein
MKVQWILCAVLLAGLAAPSSAATPERTLMDGRVDEAIQMLQSAIANHTNDGANHLLLCRAYFSESQTDDAVRECEAAIKLLPRSSEAHDWMGRAYGVKASTSGPLTGLKLAHHVRDSFEAAVALDPHSAAAIDDLAEYYVGAPNVVGGGTDKAEALAKKTEVELPQLAHRIRALIAEKQKDEPTAEREFQAAVDVAHQSDAWVDLGGYYTRHKNTPKAVDALQHAIAADKTKGPAIVDAASYLIDLHTQPEVATKALQQYLAGSNKTDAAPVIHVHLLLSDLLKNSGDKAGAKIEVNKALELAANYVAAKRALKSL